MGAVSNQKPPPLSRSAPSFRLRNQSLDTLRLRRIFDLFDSNHDGEITCNELCQALSLLGLAADEPDLSSTISTYSKPGRTGLDFDDFQNLHRSIGDGLFGELGEESRAEEEQEDEDLNEAFNVFDVDGDGFISAVELQTVLRKLGMQEASELGRVEDMICSVDKNGDGRVDLVEFKHMMRTTISIKGT